MDAGSKVDNAISLYRGGASMNSAGKSVGVTGQTVKRWLKSAGVEIRYERPTYPDSIRDQAVSLYVDQRMSAAAVAARLGIKVFTIKEWMRLAGVIRSMSEAAAISIANGAVRGRARKTAYRSSKTGEVVFADSTFELSRMISLDSDADVLWWGRCKDRIKYVDHTGKHCTYIPDLLIKLKSGITRVEEVKPREMLHKGRNPFKMCAAFLFYETIGVDYTPVTQDELELRNISDHINLSLDHAEKRKRANYMRRQRELAQTDDVRKARLARLAAYKRHRRSEKITTACADDGKKIEKRWSW